LIIFAQLCFAKFIHFTIADVGILAFQALIAIIFALGLTHIIPLLLFATAAIVHATCVPWVEDTGYGLLSLSAKSYQCIHHHRYIQSSHVQFVQFHILANKSG
jgi:hypothetical protein